MINHPLSAPSTYGDGPSTLAQRGRISGRSDLERSVCYFFCRRTRVTAWLASCYQELVSQSVFQLRCLLALTAKGGAAV